MVQHRDRTDRCTYLDVVGSKRVHHDDVLVLDATSAVLRHRGLVDGRHGYVIVLDEDVRLGVDRVLPELRVHLAFRRLPL